MNASDTPSPSVEARKALEALRKAVAHALDKKMRRGQYAVMWKDGKPAIVDAAGLRAIRRQDGQSNMPD